MWPRVVFQIALVLLVGLADAVWTGALPAGLYRLQLVPLALVFVVLLTNLRFAAWWVIGAGLIIELFSFRFFGAYLIMFWGVLGLADVLLEKVMTNRSIYSVGIIVAAATLFCDALSLLYDYMAGTPLRPAVEILKSFGLSLVYNVALGSIIFYTSSLLTRRLRPVFLVSKRNL